MVFRRILTAGLLGAAALGTLALGGATAQAASATEYGLARPAAGHCDGYLREAQDFRAEGDEARRRGDYAAADRYYEEADDAMKAYYACMRS